MYGDIERGDPRGPNKTKIKNNDFEFRLPFCINSGLKLNFYSLIK